MEATTTTAATGKKNKKKVSEKLWRKQVKRLKKIARTTKISGKWTLAAKNIGVEKNSRLLLLHACADNNNADYENNSTTTIINVSPLP